MADEDCLICLTPKMFIKNTNVVFFSKKTGLNHFFKCTCTVHCHEECMTKWLDTNPVCPICREKLEIKWTPTTYARWARIRATNTLFSLWFFRKLVLALLYFCLSIIIYKHALANSNYESYE